jgi:hypothetical protein
MSIPLPRKRKQRVDVACDFCRQRKVRHFVMMALEAVLLTTDSLDAIMRNRSVKIASHMAEIALTPYPPASKGPCVHCHRWHTPAHPHVRAPASRISASNDTTVDANTHFHGPTSSMFDGESLRQRKTVTIPASYRSDLLAEAARQRTLSYHRHDAN